jgi:hypothetical protein
MLDKQVEDSQGLLPQKKPIAHSFVHVSKKMKNKELLECSNIKLYVLIGLTGLFVFSFVFSSKISDGCVKDPFLEKKIESCSPQLVVLKENQINQQIIFTPHNFV